MISLIAIFVLPQWAKLFYPLPYQELVYSYAQRYDLDPWLVFSVIRAESRFQYDAESQVGAKGLMQIMPETGQWIAEQLGESEFDPDCLQEAEVNIAMGCWYLNYLLKEFDGNLCMGLAAYNAGINRVKDWCEQGVWDGERNSLDQIPYSETCEYVRKVLNNYEVYQAIY